VGDGKPRRPWSESVRLGRGRNSADEQALPGLRIFQIFKNCSNLQIQNGHFYCSKIFQKLNEARFEYCEQLSQLCRHQNPNRNHATNFGTYSNLNLL
jgi:hypothetical protein